MCRRAVWIALLLLVSAVMPLGAAAAPQGIVMSADPCFAQMQPDGIYPLKITVANHGPAAAGVIEVHADEFTQSLRKYDYPIDLPPGTVKQLIAYPHVEQYASALDVEFHGSARARSLQFSLYSGSSDPIQGATQVALIGDDVGGLAAARPTSAEAARTQGEDGVWNPSHGQLFSDCYCAPEDAPDRAAGYSALGVVALGAGAERLNPDQWAALRQWTLGGGSLLLLGGAGSLGYLQTSDAAALCPLRSLRDSSLAALRYPLAKGEGATLADIATVTGAAAPGATALLSRSGQPVVAKITYGLGSVTLAAFNPLTSQVRSDPHAAGIVRSLLQASRREHQFQFANMAAFGSSGPRGAAGNPFHIRLPDGGQIGAIFLAYFVLAIPVTFAVLRRVERLEWAWFTTPVVSVAFALVLYLYSAGLYKAGMTRRTQGILTASAAGTEARFRGSTELFIPRGGLYDISVPDAESLDERDALSDDSPGYSSYGRSAGDDAFTTIDTIGGVRALDYSVGNLAFRRLYYSAPMRLAGTVTGEVALGGKGAVSGRVTSSLPFALQRVIVVVPGTSKIGYVGELAPGETKPVATRNPSASTPLIPLMQPASNLPDGYVRPTAATAILAGVLPGARFGPQIGRDASGDASVTYVESMPLAPGGAKP